MIEWEYYYYSQSINFLFHWQVDVSSLIYVIFYFLKYHKFFTANKI